MTEANMSIKNQQLNRVLSIQYLVKFKKDYTKIQVLINSNTEVNAMTLADAPVLRLPVCFTNIRT